MNEQNHRDSESFSYTYDASRQEEIRQIREKYLPREEDKMERLRRLDEQVTSKASTTALITGLLGTLFLGIGMSCCMVFTGVWFIPGIVIGLAGIAGMSAAYPLYEHVLKKERRRAAPEIIRLTDELLK